MQPQWVRKKHKICSTGNWESYILGQVLPYVYIMDLESGPRPRSQFPNYPFLLQREAEGASQGLGYCGQSKGQGSPPSSLDSRERQPKWPGILVSHDSFKIEKKNNYSAFSLRGHLRESNVAGGRGEKPRKAWTALPALASLSFVCALPRATPGAGSRKAPSRWQAAVIVPRFIS